MLGRACRRVTLLKDAFPAQKDTDADDFTRLVMLIAKDKARPTRRKGLVDKVKSWFPQLTETARLALIQRLFDESGVRESQNVLTYDL